MVEAFIESLFPRLRGMPWRVTSPSSTDYNCIAWALGDTSSWWWPIQPNDATAYWPPTVARDAAVDAFVAAFVMHGFQICLDETLEPGHEKIALFANPNGEVTHAARQLPNGSWTSKLGKLEDIEHELHDLKGTEYGLIVRLLKRPLRGS